ncbi:MAG: CHAT domain-containing protein, partial [Bacteroidota bacterium]
AVVRSQQKKYQEAKYWFDQHLQSGHQAHPLISPLAQILMQAGGEQAEKQRQQLQLNQWQLAFGFLQRIKCYEEAQTYADKLSTHFGASWYTRQDDPWFSLSDLGELHEHLGIIALEKGETERGETHWQTSLSYYEKAIQALEAQRNQLSRDELKSAFGSGKGVRYIYFAAARLQVRQYLHYTTQGRHARASLLLAQSFTFAELNKSKALLDLIQDGQILREQDIEAENPILRWREKNAHASLTKSLLARERKENNPDQAHIRKWEQELQQLEFEIAEQTTALQNRFPAFYRLVDEKAPVASLKAVQNLLPEKSGLLQYYYVSEELLIWYIPQNGPIRAYCLPCDARKLDREAREFNEACRERKPWKTLGTALGDLLLHPLAENAPEDLEHLYLVPFGELHQLPFAALLLEGKPLLEHVSISYLPNASSLQYLGQGNARALRESSVLAIGNPADMRFAPPLQSEIPFPSLKGAEIEARLIAQRTGGKVLLGEAATRDQVLPELSRHAYLHFATHGYLSTQYPLLSAIILANGQYLSVAKLMGMQVQADLIVLSACQTGLGQRLGGDDLMGLTRALLASGAHAALVSIWPVNDMTTALIMIEMYDLMKQGIPVSHALRMALLKLKQLSQQEGADLFQHYADLPDETELTHLVQTNRFTGLAEKMELAAPDFSHPYFWAPFTFIGR